VNGNVHHFGAIGFTNGLAVLADRETYTHWDHITGEAFAGPLVGTRLDVWSVQMTTVVAAHAAYPNLEVSLSGYRSLQKRLAQWLYPRFIHGRILFPWFFYASLSEPIDPRLDKLTQGLGVIVGEHAKFYPLGSIAETEIKDDWQGRTLHITYGLLDGVPHAKWAGTDEEPMQLLTRWYGFSFTYPNCEVYGLERF
jgi:hypothetical protein